MVILLGSSHHQGVLLALGRNNKSEQLMNLKTMAEASGEWTKTIGTIHFPPSFLQETNPSNPPISERHEDENSLPSYVLDWLCLCCLSV